MAKPSPGASDDPLLNANAFRNDDTVPPQKVQRTPTRKERVVMTGSPKKPRTPTMVETPSVLPDTEEVAPSFRPRQRPAMAMLTIYDDGRDAGEDVRLRRDVTVIGRGQADIVIPHDDRMSGKHAEIRRAHEDGAWKWQLVDLGSTNGTFVRVHKCSIKPSQELMVGHRRFRFEDTAPPPEEPSEGKKTVSFVIPALDAAAMVELTSQGDGQRYPLPGLDNWIGRAADCTVTLDDPMIADHHVRISRDDRGWKLESHEARDGVWLRIEKPVSVDRTCSFQLGEQRFLLRVL
jgi:pSer/pThr/pTyr-binding forkhead associated (FHA) protein